MRKIRICGLIIAVSLLSGCGAKVSESQITKNSQSVPLQESPVEESQSEGAQSGETQKVEIQQTEVETQQEVVMEQDSEIQQDSEEQKETQVETQIPSKDEKPVEYVPNVPVQSGVGIEYETDPDAPWIAIDAGHQKKGNSSKEPIGPGASEKKAKVASGTEGVATGIPEYKLTLQVALRLKDELIEKGYNVLMIRETNDVDISNAERAILANEKNADAFIRIHADGAENASASGITVLCQTKDNPYCGEYYKSSLALSNALSKNMVKATGAKDRGISKVDTMSGINWCQVPVAIVEMGFMTNEKEDKLMATEAYQKKLVSGMINGIKEYLANR